MASSPVRTPTTLRLPCTAASVSVARQGLKTWLSDHDASPEGVEDARIVISELVANSVRHARPLADGTIVVSWSFANDGVEVSVTDGGGSTRPRNVRATSSALAGRGMTIVEVLSRRWWTERTDSRSTVHALLDV